jgi:hypothetical protein
MPVLPTYPGVYIEEIPSGTSTIAAVTTSVAAFVGYTPRGPLETPVTLTSFADFERAFGGLSATSVLSYAVQHFFANGGSTAIVVRLATGAEAATGKFNAGRNRALTVTAKDPSSWGNTLRVAIDDNTQVAGTFNLRVVDLAGTVSESYQNLSMTPGDSNFVEQVVNPASALISVQAAGSNPPDPSGTVSSPISAVPAATDLENKTVTAAIGQHETTFPLYDPRADGDAPTTLAQLALLIEGKIRRGGGALGGVRVAPVGTRLHAHGGTDDVLNLSGEGSTELGLAGIVHPSAHPLAGGADGGRPTSAADVIGSPDAKTGLYSLLDMIDVNLLCLPDLADPELAGARVAVLSAADQLCRDKRMFLIVDSPAEWQSLAQARAGLAELDPVRSDHSALYFPQVQVTDPLSGQPRSFPPCGVIAGMMAGHRRQPRCLEGTGRHRRRPGRCARADRAADRPGERSAQPARRELPAVLPHHRPGGLGRADAARRRRGRLGVEVHRRAADRADDRGEPLPWHEVGPVRTQRRTAVGPDQA